jgi:lycopene cyclase domain-containing protein
VSYTAAAAVGVVVAVLVDLFVLRTRLLRRRAFWTSYAIVLVGQVVTNGVLTGRDVVVYRDSAIVGWRFVYAPVEDLAFGFALVLFTLALWVWWGRRGVGREPRARGQERRPSSGATGPR